MAPPGWNKHPCASGRKTVECNWLDANAQACLNPFRAACMKVYNLSCEHDHRFEGWFASEEDFHAQSDAQHIECPVCDSHAVRKLPSAPHLSLSGAQAPQTDAGAEVRAQVMQMVRQIVANTEDVGDGFAEEARRMHYKESPERAIRGVATVQECEELVEEGIEVMPLPIPATPKRSLQ